MSLCRRGPEAKPNPNKSKERQGGSRFQRRIRIQIIAMTATRWSLLISKNVSYPAPNPNKPKSALGRRIKPLSR